MELWKHRNTITRSKRSERAGGAQRRRRAAGRRDQESASGLPAPEIAPLHSGTRKRWFMKRWFSDGSRIHASVYCCENKNSIQQKYAAIEIQNPISISTKPPLRHTQYTSSGHLESNLGLPAVRDRMLWH